VQLEACVERSTWSAAKLGSAQVDRDARRAGERPHQPHHSSGVSKRPPACTIRGAKSNHFPAVFTKSEFGGQNIRTLQISRLTMERRRIESRQARPFDRANVHDNESTQLDCHRPPRESRLATRRFARTAS
jgi:hypothetical protein